MGVSSQTRFGEPPSLCFLSHLGAVPKVPGSEHCKALALRLAGFVTATQMDEDRGETLSSC